MKQLHNQQDDYFERLQVITSVQMGSTIKCIAREAVGPRSSMLAADIATANSPQLWELTSTAGQISPVMTSHC